jgi:hypothetical protein
MTTNIESGSVLQRLRQTWQRSRNRRRALNELAACPPGELKRIASDVGLTGSDLRHLCRDDHGASELLLKRLQLLGLDPQFVRQNVPALFRDLSRVCASCQASRRCARDMAHGNVQAGMATYCPNRFTIDLLTVGDTERSPARHGG